MNLMEAWNKSLGSDGFIVKLYECIVNAGEISFAGYLSSEPVAHRLDDFYYYGWSGDKECSPLMEKLGGTPEGIIEIVSSFWEIYGQQLYRQWENFTREYDPIDDYDVTEETTYVHTGSGSAVDTGSDKNKKTGQVETTNDVWGVNSSTGVNSDKSTTVYGQGSTPMQTEVEYGKTRTTSEGANDDLTIHKHGNLGINPISKFLKDDIELWRWNFYRQVLFPMIDRHIAIPIY